MRLQQDFNEGNLIRRYGPGAVTINERTVTRSVIVTPVSIVDWAVDDFDALRAEHLQAIAGMEPELVLLGTGASQRFPSPAIMTALYDRGIGVEVMTTDAACRTYNIVMAEGRAVAAALLMI